MIIYDYIYTYYIQPYMIMYKLYINFFTRAILRSSMS